MGRVNSAVFTHVRDFEHRIDWEQAKVLYHSNDVYNRLTVESALIKEVRNFNNTDGATSIDNFSKSIILSANSSILEKLPRPP